MAKYYYSLIYIILIIKLNIKIEQIKTEIVIKLQSNERDVELTNTMLGKSKTKLKSYKPILLPSILTKIFDFD